MQMFMIFVKHFIERVAIRLHHFVRSVRVVTRNVVQNKLATVMRIVRGNHGKVKKAKQWMRCLLKKIFTKLIDSFLHVGRTIKKHSQQFWVKILYYTFSLILSALPPFSQLPMHVK